MTNHKIKAIKEIHENKRMLEIKVHNLRNENAEIKL
jgi:hypothetical protein